jgi:hypothetical protein
MASHVPSGATTTAPTPPRWPVSRVVGLPAGGRVHGRTTTPHPPRMARNHRTSADVDYMPMGLLVGLPDEMGGEDVLTRAAVGLVFAVPGAGAAVAVSGVPHEVGGLAAVDVGNGTIDADVA